MKIKVKTWEELEQEFGVDELGTIKTPILYFKSMEKNMPPGRIVEVIETENSYVWVVNGICWHLDRGVAK